ncbi:MAG: hypothetical protein GWP03_06385 [Proteobacteria bacterium]|nr:hypothetical protein [Pseudomonadota bacterium]
MKRYLILLLSVLPVFLYGEAGTESIISRLGTSGASGAMGNAYTSIKSPYSIVFNPSLIDAKNIVSLTYMHDILQYGANYDVGTAVLDFGLPFDKGVKNNSVSLAYYLLSEDGIPITEAGNDTIGGTNFVNIVYKGTASYMFSRTDCAIKRKIGDFDAGFLYSYLYSSMYNVKGKGYGLGWGFSYDRDIKNSIISGVGAGISYGTVSNLIWSNDAVDTIDCNLRAGANIRILKGIANALDDGIVISFDAIQSGDMRRLKPDYNIGIEWKVFGTVPVRMGFENGNFTAGIGFQTRYVNFDYAFISNPTVSSSHKFSITLNL